MATTRIRIILEEVEGPPLNPQIIQNLVWRVRRCWVKRNNHQLVIDENLFLSFDDAARWIELMKTTKM